MRIESGSSLTTFLSCPKLYEFRYDQRLESLGYSSSLQYGTFIHAWREKFNGGDVGAPTREWREADVRIDQLQLPEQREQQREQMKHDYMLAMEVANRQQAFWLAYDGQLGDGQLQFVEAEKEWKLPFEGRALVGKRDGLVLHKGYQKHFLYELKTAGDADRETYKLKLQLDRQVSTNIYAVRGEGKACDGAIYDIVWKPRLIRKVDRKTMPDETLEDFRTRILADIDVRPAHYFERLIVYRSDKDLSEAIRDTYQQFALLEASEQTGKPRNQSNCEKFGKLCSFFALCMDGQEESRSVFKVRDRKLPELGLEVQGDACASR